MSESKIPLGKGKELGVAVATPRVSEVVSRCFVAETDHRERQVRLVRLEDAAVERKKLDQVGFREKRLV